MLKKSTTFKYRLDLLAPDVNVGIQIIVYFFLKRTFQVRVNVIQIIVYIFLKRTVQL